MKVPCEIVVWYVLPGLRRELAIVLANEHNMTQASISRQFGLTQAAVSQYISSKRGEMELPDDFHSEIKLSAERIASGGKETVAKELCRLCEHAKEIGLIDTIYKEIENKPASQ